MTKSKKTRRKYSDDILIIGDFTIRDNLTKDPIFRSKKGKNKLKDILDLL